MLAGSFAAAMRAQKQCVCTGRLAQQLQQQIDSIAADSGAPVFEPHVTLIGGVHRPEAEVLSVAADLAARLQVRCRISGFVPVHVPRRLPAVARSQALHHAHVLIFVHAVRSPTSCNSRTWISGRPSTSACTSAYSRSRLSCMPALRHGRRTVAIATRRTCRTCRCYTQPSTKTHGVANRCTQPCRCHDTTSSI